MDGIRERIAKLLALGESPNENEARAALRKARKLMAQHKLTSADVMRDEDEQVREVFTKFSCTKQRDPWMAQLAVVIAKNHCCQAVVGTVKGTRTHNIRFWGVGDDPEIVAGIFAYACRCVTDWQRSLKRRNPGVSMTDLRSHMDGYGYGFTIGVRDMYEEQNRQHAEYGLMIVVPKVVEDAMAKLTPLDIRGSVKPDDKAKSLGYRDGRRFDPGTKLPQGAM